MKQIFTTMGAGVISTVVAIGLLTLLFENDNSILGVMARVARSQIQSTQEKTVNSMQYRSDDLRFEVVLQQDNPTTGKEYRGKDLFLVSPQENVFVNFYIEHLYYADGKQEVTLTGGRDNPVISFPKEDVYEVVLLVEHQRIGRKFYVKTGG